MFGTGGQAGTGYLPILPVDQGIEHSGDGAIRSKIRSGARRDHDGSATC